MVLPKMRLISITHNKMIKLLVFDFDGTLASLKEAHFQSLNQALATINAKFVISEEDQVSTFEGLSTRNKLNILVKERNFSPNKIEEVFQIKQELTSQAIEATLHFDPLLDHTFKLLKQEGYQLMVASNAIRSTIEAGLKKLGISHYFDKVISNEDVKHTKPHPEIYLKAMIEAGVDPSEILIIEDSKTGRESAFRSGAHICDVNFPQETTYENIQTAIRRANRAIRPIKWSARQTCNVLILASGSGSRMRAKHHLPKPLIDVAGKPMIQRVVENLNIDAQFIFVVQAEHCTNYNLESYLNLIAPDCHIVKTDGLTAGAACSALLAKEYINNDKQLLIANSDQYIEWDSASFMYSMISSGIDGQILTFKDLSRNPKWSYAKTDEKGYVIEVAEKKPISDDATTGIYGFSKGSDFVFAAEQMISKDIRTNGEFYLAPSYNELIQAGKRIKIFECQKMMGLGTIEDLEQFLESYNE